MAQSDLLVTRWCKNVESLPANYIMPPEKRPSDFSSICRDIPVLDLGKATSCTHSRADLIDQVIKASEEFGAFQVINHGVSEEMMHEAMKLYEEFFNLPAEENESLLSDDFYKTVRLYTSGYNYANEDFHLWKDTLKHPGHPISEEVLQGWPKKPDRYRELIAKYSVEVRKMGYWILDLICEGLGLEEGFFRGELSKGMGMVINNYPPCPDPSLAMGIHAHCDAFLLTIIHQNVYGLQIKNKNGEWTGVDPLPNAFVIMIPYQLLIISNGKLRSCEHRGVTNSSAARISIITFFGPAKDCVIGPAKQHVSDSNPPRFKTYKYIDFQINYLFHLSQKNLCNETALGPYLL